MALIGWENAVEAVGVVLTASDAAPGFGPELLRVPWGTPSVAWQTRAGVVAASLGITSPVPLSWRAICLARTNLTTGATIRVRAGAYDSGVVSAGVAVGIGQALHILPAGVSALALQIDIVDAANPDGLINVPLAYAGPGNAIAIYPSSKPGRDVRRADAQTRGGGVLPSPLSAGRTWQIDFDLIPDAEGVWMDALEAAGAAGRNVLFVPRLAYARPASEALFGLFSAGARGFADDYGDLRNWTATITERL